MAELTNVRSYRYNEVVPSASVDCLRDMMDNLSFNLRVACPGIIQSWDPDEMTVSVQPSIRENILTDSMKFETVELPLLIHVPVIYPRCGDFIMTFPLAKGDECLVIFADRSIDAWWQSGDIQNTMKGFVHDLSDGFCIPSPSSQPKKIANISSDAIVIRNIEGDAYIELKKNKDINIVTEGNINLTASENLSMEATRIDLN